MLRCITLILMFCSLICNAQISDININNKEIVDSLSRRIDLIESQLNKIQSDYEKYVFANNAQIEKKDSLIRDLTSQVASYVDQNNVNWSLHIFFLDTAIAAMGLIIAIFTVMQGYNLFVIKKNTQKALNVSQNATQLSEQLAKKVDIQESLNNSFNQTARDLQNVKLEIEEKQKEQKELSIEFLAVATGFYIGCADDIKIKDLKDIDNALYFLLSAIKMVVLRGDKNADILYKKIKDLLDSKIWKESENNKIVEKSIWKNMILLKIEIDKIESETIKNAFLKPFLEISDICKSKFRSCDL